MVPLNPQNLGSIFEIYKASSVLRDFTTTSISNIPILFYVQNKQFTGGSDRLTDICVLSPNISPFALTSIGLQVRKSFDECLSM